MGLPRFYHPEPLSIHHNIKLTENAARHASVVLRLTLGDEVILFNGDGFDYHGKIIGVSRNETVVKLDVQQVIECESSLRLHLVQAVCKLDRMDWIMQKAVELGINEITPVITKHCSIKVNAKKHQHWEGIILSACEQSGRAIIPTLHEIVTLEKFLADKVDNGVELKLIFHPETQIKFSSLKYHPTSVLFMIGPAGGFHDDEVKWANDNGFLSARLGSRILRTETAALAALSALQSRWGDF